MNVKINMKVYGVFQNFWEGDGYLVKELTIPSVFLSSSSAIGHGISLVNEWNESQKRGYEMKKQRLEEEKAKGWYSTERLEEEKYAILLELNKTVSDEQEDSGYYGHPPYFTVEAIEVLG